MNSLQAKHVTVKRSGRPIIDDISFNLAPGDMHGIVGPNGSGKSTLLRALAGIWNVFTGAVLLDDCLLVDLSRKEIAKRISLVPQEAHFDFAFTVREIVAMGRFPHRGKFEWENSADRKAIELALDKCGVAHLRDRAVNTLSGGERQRVVIARSLAVEPDFILLDEPTASLDLQHALEILELCKRLAHAGKAIAFATHDLNAVAHYASQVALMSEGKLVAVGKSFEVLTPKRIAGVFGVHTEILTTSSGEPIYVFRERN